ncbi:MULTISPECIES: glycine cleavage T C-terminal barrel domain-containing protein [unclassified Pseudovibrio]|uniref:glycine cleavage T C-terminal barrel domain-containing protein n=1 Tax=unclassified Pseudovibrio TaxID=2627060 RepID=UPI0007AE7577|nr:MULTISPECIES: glycine cleavage T C-terminal barrel domain-containing protein [unclassified Pseudovibrio]KZL02215.1 Aminomethyltransferase [Pseudovibrio sp. W74]KZL08239.1 Aminomethyltransferase [Pseudovibrio sp. Ad14]
MSGSYEVLRNDVGIVDCGCWVRTQISGPDACAALDSVVGANMHELFDGRAINTLIPSLTGGVDAILWVAAVENNYLLIAEPSEQETIEAVLAELTSKFDISITNKQSDTSHLMLTGPNAETLAVDTLGDDVHSIGFLSVFELPESVLAMRIGYFGEYELHLFGEKEKQDDLLRQFADQCGKDLLVSPVGLPAMMAEMRILNTKRDIPQNVSVFEAGLQWMIDFQKTTLRAKSELDAKKKAVRNLCMLVVLEADIVEAGAQLVVEGQEVGWVQSAFFSPTLGKWVAIAYLQKDICAPGLLLQTQIGLANTVSAPAFLSVSVRNALEQAA